MLENISIVFYYPYRCLSVIPIIKIEESPTVMEVLYQLLDKSGGKLDNHISFKVITLTGDILYVGWADNVLSIGTTANKES